MQNQLALIEFNIATRWACEHERWTCEHEQWACDLIILNTK
jgi:hypothetical protein